MFTQIPNNLSSLYSELSYTYYSSYSRDMTLQIYEDETDDLLGVKKFYSTTSAQINIAPHIRPFAMPTIDAEPMGFISTYRNGNISVYVKMSEANTKSTTRQFTISRGDLEVRGLVSSLPAVRGIADGETEQLHLAVESGDQVKVVVTRYLTGWNSSYETPYLDGEYNENLISQTTYTTTPSDSNLAIFNFVASSQMDGDGSQIEKYVVTASQNSEQIAQVTYHILDSPVDAIRLAWLSESGSIEHYTFPVVKESHVGEKFKKVVTLTSAFEGYATRAALAEIIRSPMIWVENGGVYLDAEAEASEISVLSTTSLGCIDIKISYND